MRLPVALLACLTVLAVAAGAAHANGGSSAVLVLDRGADAKAGAASDAGNALRIWKALEARGVDTRLVAAGVGSSGETQIAAVQPTRAGIASLDEDPVFSFRGPTDARAALAHVLDATPKGAVDVILLGPWSEVAVEKARAFSGTIKRWDARAPEDSRILAIGRGPGRQVLAPARGWVGDGRVVVGFGAPRIETQGYSPLPRTDGPAAPLAASIRVLGDVLWMGAPAEGGDKSSAVLTVASDVPEDRFEARVLAGLHTWSLSRRVEDGRTATLTFRRVEDDTVHWIVPPPQPLTFQWEDLKADARLLGPQAEAVPVFAAVDAEAGKPVSTAFRLLRTLSGRTPAWRVGVEEGALPPGLDVRVGDEARTSPEVAEAEVRVTFKAQAGRPLEARGVITLTADGMPRTLKLPYEIRVQPGRFAWEITPAPAAIPHAEKDARTRLVLRPTNGNAPKGLPLRAACDDGEEAWLGARVHVSGGGVVPWDLAEPFDLAAGVAHELEFVLAGELPQDVSWPVTVTLTPGTVDGVEVDAKPVEVTVRHREPRLILALPLSEHRLEGSTLLTDKPPVLTLDADGGDGAWLVDLLETEPVVRVLGDAPIGWQAVPRGSGTWHLLPAGRWTGAAPGIFEDETLDIELAFDWPPGAVPATAKVPVRIPARWGRKGILLVVLAGLALLLALTVVGWMRTPPVRGTLLYTVDGLEGTVGRLDLEPVKRRTRPVTSDPRGRLSVDGEGKVVARVRATRVGGMLEYTDEGGARERRLLVDGMSLRLGRHLVRYVSGRAHEVSEAEAPTEVPDLLGPEYDLESGRIERLDEDGPDRS
ncbi:MAG: hypothetical protein QNJ90_09385 [Planctomycetota bacterium]|nr:hypothetical protein [Planctomycetota bacterium]